MFLDKQTGSTEIHLSNFRTSIERSYDVQILSAKYGTVITLNEDNLHEMSNPVFWKNKKKKTHICCLLFMPREW